jgi:hypothetical protein
VLPQDGDEHEDGGDEDEGEGDLADKPRGEGLDVDVGAGDFVVLVVPAGEGGEEDEREEGEDDGDDPISRRLALAPGNLWEIWGGETYRRYGNTTASLKVCATQIRLNGS